MTAGPSGVPTIRSACGADLEAIGRLVGPIVREGRTLALPTTFDDRQAATYWMGADKATYVAETDGAIAGAYYLRANQLGRGAHVANAGYVTAPAARGQGLARAMGRHSLTTAKALGYRAMQFNFVIACNEAAVHLWTSLGFAIVGRVPEAFDHPDHGLVDALVMYRLL